MGCPCCGVFQCTEPLLNNHHLFCATHDHLHSVCHIINCDEPVVVKEIITPDGRVIQKRMKTCSLPLHQEMEHLKFAKGKAAFTLKEHYRDRQNSHPAPVGLAEENMDHNPEEGIEYFSKDSKTRELSMSFRTYKSTMHQNDQGYT